VAPLTVAATGINRIYDATAVATVTLNVPAFPLDAVTGSYGSASFLTKTVGNGKTVNVSGIAISGADALNYQLQNTTAGTTANITKRDLTVNATAANKLWDGNTTATVTLTATPLSGDGVTPMGYASANFDNPNVGAGKTVTVLGVTLGGADGGNYSPVPAPVTTTASIGSWTLAGYYQPVDMTGGGMVWNTVKGGSTVPLKFQIYVGSVERTDVGAVRSFNATSISCGATGQEDAIEFTTTGGTELRYSGGQFIQNWQTPRTPGACLRTTMTAQDGSKLEAYFKLK
jgi:YDG domain